MRVNLATRMFLASATLALVLGAMLVALFRNVDVLESSAGATARSQRAVAEGDRLERLTIDLETGVRGFQATGDPAFLAPWRQARRDLPDVGRRLVALAAADGGQAAQAHRLVDAVERYERSYTEPLVRTLRAGPLSRARGRRLMTLGKRRVDALRRSFHRFAAAQSRRSSTRVGLARQRLDTIEGLALLAVFGSTLLAVVFALLGTRSVAAPIRRLARAAERIANGDRSVRVPEAGAAEVGALARTFNGMTASLDRALADVEDGRRRLRSIIDTANDAFVATDAQGRITDWNQQAERMFGWAPSEARGRTLAGVLATSSGAAPTLAPGDGRVELVGRGRDGREFPVEATLWRVGAEGGGLNAFLQDITERKAAEAEIQRLAYEHAEDLAAVAAVARGLPRTADAAGARRAICEAARDVCDATLVALVEPAGDGSFTATGCAGMTLDVRIPASADGSVCGAALAHGEPIAVADIDGEPRVAAAFRGRGLVSGVWQPVLQDGRPVGVLVVVWDRPLDAVSRRAPAVAALFAAECAVAIERADMLARLDAANRTLALQVEALRVSDQMKSDFVSSVSHELRTPLASIVGYVDVLREGDLSEAERGDFLRIVHDNAERLNVLIDDLLTLAGLESGRMVMRAEPSDLRPLAEEVVRDQQPASHEKGQQVALELPVEPLVATVDADRFRQVLSNLVANAIKFTPAGGRIAVALEADGESARVAVRDSGIGIAPDETPRLFERFFRARNATDRSIPGTGLGLAISKAIIDAHGGTIEVASRLDHGSTFSVRVPRLAVAAELALAA